MMKYSPISRRKRKDAQDNLVIFCVLVAMMSLFIGGLHLFGPIVPFTLFGLGMTALVASFIYSALGNLWLAPLKDEGNAL